MTSQVDKYANEALCTAPPTQNPPPRLTEAEIFNADPLPHVMFDAQRIDFARAIETLVRKQFGVED